MKNIPIPIEERSKHAGATHMMEIKCTDLTQTTANTAQLFTLADVVNGDAVSVLETELVEAFEDVSDAAFNDCAITIGDGGNAARLLASQQLNKNGTEVFRQAGTGAFYQFTTGDTVDVTFGSMSGKSLVNLDKGKVRIYYKLERLPA